MVSISGLIHSSQRKSQTGQAQILAAVLFLLLIPTTIIVAQNATENITGNLAANLSMEDAAQGAPPANQTNETSQTQEAPPLNNTNTTATQDNQTEPINDTNVTLPENITIPGLNITVNVTPQTNETNITATDNSTGSVGPLLSIKLNVPERANRNEPFLLSAEITNSGDTDTMVDVEWVLPDGFSILSGSGSHPCDVPAGGSCRSEIEAVATLSSMLGEQEVKILVRYDG